MRPQQEYQIALDVHKEYWNQYKNGPVRFLFPGFDNWLESKAKLAPQKWECVKDFSTDGNKLKKGITYNENDFGVVGINPEDFPVHLKKVEPVISKMESTEYTMAQAVNDIQAIYDNQTYHAWWDFWPIIERMKQAAEPVDYRAVLEDVLELLGEGMPFECIRKSITIIKQALKEGETK